jgi:hypothetical protein
MSNWKSPEKHINMRALVAAFDTYGYNEFSPLMFKSLYAKWIKRRVSKTKVRFDGPYSREEWTSMRQQWNYSEGVQCLSAAVQLGYLTRVRRGVYQCTRILQLTSEQEAWS